LGIGRRKDQHFLDRKPPLTQIWVLARFIRHRWAVVETLNASAQARVSPGNRGIARRLSPVQFILEGLQGAERPNRSQIR